MGYDPISVINKMRKLDGGQLGHYNKLNPYVLTNEPSFTGPLNVNNIQLYPNRIASVVLVGISTDRNPSGSPILIDVDVPKFIALMRRSTYDTDAANSNSFFSDAYKPNEHYTATQKQHAIQISTYDLQTLNSVLVSSAPTYPYFGASTITSNKSNNDLDYWAKIDREYCDVDKPNKPKLSTKVSTYTLLFYTLYACGEIQARYGYHVPDPQHAHSAFNWIRASPTGSAGDSEQYYFKWLYLTEFDAYAHAGMVANPENLTASFVQQPIFASMVATMQYSNKDLTRYPADTSEDRLVDQTHRDYHSVFHSSLLRKGDYLTNGQYIYSKDFSYKLHLDYNGCLLVYKLPITSSDLSECHYAINSTASTLSVDTFPCAVLSIQRDTNLSIYGGPAMKSVWASDTYNNPYSLLGTGSGTYSVLLVPGGALVMANGGLGKDGRASYIAGTTLGQGTNWKYTTDRNDPDCVNGWSYVKMDSSAISTDLVSSLLSDGKTWCYTSWALTPNQYAPKNMSFKDSDLQMVAYTAGTDKLDKTTKVYDVIYNIVKGAFMAKATSLGFVFNQAIQDEFLYQHCMRGDRWASDSSCSSAIVRLATNSAYSSTIDFKANLLCNANYNSNCATLCTHLKSPNPVLLSLMAKNPAFANFAPRVEGAYLPAAKPIEELLGSFEFTEVELNYLYNAVAATANTMVEQVWKNKYKTLLQIEPYGTKDFGPDALNAIYSYASVKSLPNTIIAFKTTAGVFYSQTNMDMPYVTTATSFPATDPIWKRILLSTPMSPVNKWEGPSFLAITVADLPASDARQCYALQIITITGLVNNSTASAFMFIKSRNVEDWIPYLRRVEPVQTAHLLAKSSICAVLPDACYTEARAYIDSNLFDPVGHKFCDLAVSGITRNGETNLGYLKSENAAKLKEICPIQFAKSNCSMASMRYPPANATSGFRNRSVGAPSYMRVFEGFSLMEGKELYSDNTCPGICATAMAGSTLFESCRTGSVAYCSQGDNILSANCIADATKYPEVAAQMKTWCGTESNNTHPQYATYCPTPAPAADSTASATTVTAATNTTAKTTGTPASVDPVITAIATASEIPATYIKPVTTASTADVVSVLPNTTESTAVKLASNAVPETSDAEATNPYQNVSATTAGTAGTVTAAQTGGAADAPAAKEALDMKMIGIILGCICVVLIAAVSGFFLYRRSRARKQPYQQEPTETLTDTADGTENVLQDPYA